MSSLLSDSQLAALQNVAKPQFTTLATIKRPSPESDELGDDGAQKDPPTIGTVYGWLSSSPTAEPTLDGGALVTANTFRWGCPVGTDIRPRDRLVIGSATYVVTDTTADETWPVMLSCSLRLRE